MGNWLLYKAAKHRAKVLAEVAGEHGASLALIWAVATSTDPEYETYVKVFRKELIDEYEADCKGVA